MKAFVFPGQGAQFSGMGKDLYDASDKARVRFEEANDILGFDIASIMFEGTPTNSSRLRSHNPPFSCTPSFLPNAWATTFSQTWLRATASVSSVPWWLQAH